MNSLVTTTEQKGLVVPTSIASTIEASDIEIPKILLMQGLSDYVAEQKASMGDFVDSLNAAKLGDPKSVMNLIPIIMWKDYCITELKGKKYEWCGFEPYTAATAHLRNSEHWEFEHNGVPRQRNLRMNFAFLLEKDASDLGALPYVMSFQRTGLKTGKTMANFFLKAQVKGKKPWFFTLGLTSKMEKNDLGSYYVASLATATETKLDVTDACSTWESIFAQGAAKVDERDVKAAPSEGDLPF